MLKQVLPTVKYAIGKPVTMFQEKRMFHRTRSLFKNSLINENDEDENCSPERTEMSLIEPRKNSEEEIDDIVSPRVPKFIPEVLSIPVTRRPLFPGFYKTISIRNSLVANRIAKEFKKGKSYLGIFLSKHERDSDVITDLNEIYSIGVLSQLVNISILENKTATAIVLPQRRIFAKSIKSNNSVTRMVVENYPDEPYSKKSKVLKAISQEIFSVLTDIAKLNPFFKEHILHHNVTGNVFEDPAKLADFVAILTSGESAELQDVLESSDIEDRLRKSLVLLKKELVNAQLQNEIARDIESKMSETQRKFFLNEQHKIIKKELGLESNSKEKAVEEFKRKSETLVFPQNVKDVFEEELSKFSSMESSSPDYNLTKNYLTWITQLPWGIHSEECFDYQVAKKILDEDHFGLDDIKDRILEFIAIGKLKGSIQGKIICFVGPPGTGKTSIGKSIARALNRKYYRFSVGGLTDVAEIKGHRRTYIGAGPGKFMQALKITGNENPLILIDEVDKIGTSHRGDPTSALLEVLDPEQNSSFLDHYLDVPVDMSKVLFVCTANVTDTIPGPLLDRMEIIPLSGYILEEKMEIAKKYLIPDAIESSGLKKENIAIENDALKFLIKSYCRESGVRNLKKQIEKILRKLALKSVKQEGSEFKITERNLKDFIGKPIYGDEKFYKETPVGVVMGLAWTSLGGSILYIESKSEKVSDTASVKFIRTGQLGKVMEESSMIANTFAKSFVSAYDPENRFFDTNSIHIHVPEGATPKDGPSAGSTMATCLISLALGKPVKKNLSMTGELTLTGKILKIGGVKEKAIAAKRADVKEIIFPAENKADWDELPEHIKNDLNPHFVDHYDEIFKLAF